MSSVDCIRRKRESEDVFLHTTELRADFLFEKASAITSFEFVIENREKL